MNEVTLYENKRGALYVLGNNGISLFDAVTGEYHSSVKNTRAKPTKRVHNEQTFKAGNRVTIVRKPKNIDGDYEQTHWYNSWLDDQDWYVDECVTATVMESNRHGVQLAGIPFLFPSSSLRYSPLGADYPVPNNPNIKLTEPGKFKVGDTVRVKAVLSSEGVHNKFGFNNSFVDEMQCQIGNQMEVTKLSGDAYDLDDLYSYPSCCLELAADVKCETEVTTKPTDSEESTMNYETTTKQAPFWIIGSITNDGAMSIASNPVKHYTLDEANTEAERLARKSPGKQFIVLKREGVVQAQSVVWN